VGRSIRASERWLDVLIGIVTGIALFMLAATRFEWRWARPLTDRWARARPYVQSYVRLAPGTFLYLFILFITTWVLRSSTATVGKILLQEHSTNIQHLRNDLVGVLGTSAFWLTGREVFLWAVLFPIVLAPAERWLGTLRTVVAFAIGHVTATVLTAEGLAWLIAHHRAPHRLTGVVDVGSSYGFWCVAAVFTYRLPGRWRWAWAATLVAAAASLAAWHQAFADYGHLVAILCGLALVGLTRAPGPRHRLSWPIWQPPAPLVEIERQRIAVNDEVRRRPRGSIYH
jgi:hypothetical protein